jgi:hypothetical protein
MGKFVIIKTAANDAIDGADHWGVYEHQAPPGQLAQVGVSSHLARLNSFEKESEAREYLKNIINKKG